MEIIRNAFINCKVELSLTWNQNCILSTAGTAATFVKTDAKFYVPVVTLKVEDNTKLSKLSSEGFKRLIYWNEYRLIPNKNYAANDYIRERLDASIQGVNRLFAFSYMRGANFTSENSYNIYFLPRLKIDNYNIEIDRRNFCHQPISDSIKQYNKIRKNINRTRWWLNKWLFIRFCFSFKENYRSIAADLSKQKALHADSRAIHQIIFTGKTSAAVIIYYILEKSKETMLAFAKGTTKVL